MLTGRMPCRSMLWGGFLPEETYRPCNAQWEIKQLWQIKRKLACVFLYITVSNVHGFN